MDVAVRRLGSISAKINSLKEEGISRAKYTPHIMHAPDIIEYNNDRYLFCLPEFSH
jgi:hypothetical protein